MNALWLEVVKLLELQPFFSEAWSELEVGAATAELLTVVAKKRAEASAARAQAETLLHRLRAEQEWQTYFRLQSLANWTPEMFCRESAGELLREANRLIDTLEAHRALRFQAAERLDETSDLRRLDDLAVLRDQVRAQFQSVLDVMAQESVAPPIESHAEGLPRDEARPADAVMIHEPGLTIATPPEHGDKVSEVPAEASAFAERLSAVEELPAEQATPPAPAGPAATFAAAAPQEPLAAEEAQASRAGEEPGIVEVEPDPKIEQSLEHQVAASNHSGEPVAPEIDEHRVETEPPVPQVNGPARPEDRQDKGTVTDPAREITAAPPGSGDEPGDRKPPEPESSQPRSDSIEGGPIGGDPAIPVPPDAPAVGEEETSRNEAPPKNEAAQESAGPATNGPEEAGGPRTPRKGKSNGPKVEESLPQAPFTPVGAWCRYLEEGDVAAAYWVARCLEGQGQLTFSPPLLNLCNTAVQPLAGNDTAEVYNVALHVFSGLDNENEDNEVRLLLAEEDEPEQMRERGRQDAVRLLRIAAVLQPMLFSELPFPQPMLEPPQSNPWLNELTDLSLRLYQSVGGAFHRETWCHVANWLRFQRGIRALEAKLHADYLDWETRVGECATLSNLTPSVEYLLRPGQELRKLIEIVQLDHWHRAEEIEELQKHWRDERYVAAVTWQATNAAIPKEIRPGWAPLYGTPLQKLARCVFPGCECARNWCEWVTFADDTPRASDYRQELQRAARIGRLIEKFLLDVGPVRLRLSDFVSASQAPVRSAASFLLRALDQVIGTFSAADEPGECLRIEPETLLNRRLWWYPELDFSQAGELLGGQADTVLSLMDGTPLTDEAKRLAAHGWLDRGIAEGAERLLPFLPSAERNHVEQEIADTGKELAENHRARAAKLIQELADQRASGWIEETDYTVYRDQLREIDSGGAAGRTGTDADLEQIMDGLRDNAARRRAEVAVSVDKLRARIGAAPISAQTRADVMMALDRLIDDAARPCEEIVAQIHTLLDSGSEFEKNIVPILTATAPPDSSAEADGAFEEFVKRSPILEELLRGAGGINAVQLHVREGYPPRQLGEIQSNPSLAAELVKDLAAWNGLRDATDARAAADCVARVLATLGFGPAGVAGLLEPTAEFAGRLIYLRVSRSFPGAQTQEFGSEARQNYRITVVPRAAAADDILAQLREDRWPQILFYCGSLALDQRRNLGARLQGAKRSTLILDDVLFLFLVCRPARTRNKALSLCTLPFGSLNPFNAEESVPVPEEMFVGRKRMLDAIRTGSQNVLLYGGRQLGKSALLMNLHKDSERDPDTIAIHHIVGTDAADSIWEVIDNRLRKKKFIEDTFPRKERDKIEPVITAAAKRDLRRVLVLLDEVDAFLRHELRNGMANLNAIRRIHAHAGKQFRVVLAGNYSLLRYAELLRGEGQNGASELYDKKVVGPLDFVDAVKLIRKVELLGYRFQGQAGRDAIYRILDYTFCQAGLLQLFLHHLVNRLKRREGPRVLPVCITAQDIDDVAQADNQAVLRKLCERFRMTVGLDVEYELILLSLLLLLPEGAGKYLEPAAIREELRRHWPEGHDHILQVRFKGAVREMEEKWLLARLKEMVGLGVLLEWNGRFSIRSGNLRRLYGETGVQSTLDRKVREAPTEDNRIESWHTITDGRGFSLLNSQDQAVLASPETDCATVAGARLAGAHELYAELSRLRERRSATGVLSVPVSIRRPVELAAWFRDWFPPNTEKNGRYYVMHDLAPEAAAVLDEFHDIALGSAARSTGRVAAVCFRLSPVALYSALLACPSALEPGSRTRGAGDRRPPAILLRPWDLEAVRARLYDNKREPSTEDARDVCRLTGAWPLFLDAFDEHLRKHEFPRAAEADWLKHRGRRAAEFLLALELPTGAPLFQALDELVSQGGVFQAESDDWLTAAGFASEPERRAALSTLRQLRYVQVGSGQDGLIEPETILRELWKAGCAAQAGVASA